MFCLSFSRLGYPSSLLILAIICLLTIYNCSIKTCERTHTILGRFVATGDSILPSSVSDRLADRNVLYCDIIV